MTPERLKEITTTKLARWIGEPIFVVEKHIGTPADQPGRVIKSTPPDYQGKVLPFEEYHLILGELAEELKGTELEIEPMQALVKAKTWSGKTKVQAGWGEYCAVIEALLPAVKAKLEASPQASLLGGGNGHSVSLGGPVPIPISAALVSDVESVRMRGEAERLLAAAEEQKAEAREMVAEAKDYVARMMDDARAEIAKMLTDAKAQTESSGVGSMLTGAQLKDARVMLERPEPPNAEPAAEEPPAEVQRELPVGGKKGK